MKIPEPVTPLSNVEKELAMLAGELIAENAMSTVEIYLAKLLGRYSGELPNPISKIEKYLGRMVGTYEGDTFPRPIYSTEKYFATYAGLWNDELPEVSNRVEYFLNKLIGNTGKFITVSGSGRVITFVDTEISDNLQDLSLYGRSTQETTTGAQLFDRATATENAILFWNSGGIFNENGGILSDFIPVQYEKTYTSNYFAQFGLFDDEYNFIKIYGQPEHNTYYKSVTINDENVSYIRLGFRSINGHGVNDVDFTEVTDIMVNKGSTAKPWESYTGGIPAPNPDYPMPIISPGLDNGDVNVRVGGKNFFDYDDVIVNGVIINDGRDFNSIPGFFDNRLDAEERGERLFKVQLYINRQIIPGYQISIYVPFGVSRRVKAIYSKKYNNSNTIRIANAGATKEISIYHSLAAIPEDTSFVVSFDIIENEIDAFTIGNIQIELNSDATPYEPYKTPQFITAKTPTGLHGIPVDSNGNYTDENGQQWICDEVDFEKGVYIQRCKTIELNANMSMSFNETSGNRAGILLPEVNNLEQSKPCAYMDLFTYNPHIYSDLIYLDEIGFTVARSRLFIRFGTNSEINSIKKLREFIEQNKPKIQVILATPVEIPLTAEELAQYYAVTSYPDTTVITNDENVWMTASVKSKEKSMYKMRRSVVQYE